MTDPDDTLTAVFGGDLGGQTVTALAGYLADGGTLVFNTGAPSARAGSTGPWPARPGIVVNVGPPVPGMPGTLVNLGGGVTRTARILTAAAEALRACGHAPGPAAAQPAGDATSWTFDDQGVPSHGRVRVRVGAGGYVHAGVTHAGGRWAPVYEVPLVPAAAAASEAVLSLPPDAGAFTFFWTQAPRTPGHPGHWECEEHGGRIFRVTTHIRRRPATA